MFNTYYLKISFLLAVCIGVIFALCVLATQTTHATTSPVFGSSTDDLNDGDLITSYGPDIYIFKRAEDGSIHKRLILNPQIFDSYGHLRWDNVLTIPNSTMRYIPTSTLVREVNEEGKIVGDGKVFHLVPDGDFGFKRHVQLTQEQFLNAGGEPSSIYDMNSHEASETFYKTGPPITTVEEFKSEVTDKKQVHISDDIPVPTNFDVTVSDVTNAASEETSVLTISLDVSSDATGYQLQRTSDMTAECQSPIQGWSALPGSKFGKISYVERNVLLLPTPKTYVPPPPPGTYQFRVRGTNYDNVRSEWACITKTIDDYVCKGLQCSHEQST